MQDIVKRQNYLREYRERNKNTYDMCEVCEKLIKRSNKWMHQKTKIHILQSQIQKLSSLN
jgi:hypothetical protein